ncbi:hypothetical protein OPT61_g1168 [Boeremia exigua]|uniref:Uncharacterized protein n=1 Tax=Boeremia exigua TaxID=749465 RepID=A0ACC2IRD0_9PLEO|nr:hypothetical protein OPT61_g1168 [Boeremia exigua]
MDHTICALESDKSTSDKQADTYSLLQTPPRTPSIIASSSQTLASHIRSIHQALSELSDLAPGDTVNSLLTQLVSLCVEPRSHEFTTQFFNIQGIPKLCEQLRPICAKAEGELETFWAKKIISESLKMKGKVMSQFRALIGQHLLATSTQTQALLSMFPYHQNYLDLSRLECAALSAFLPTTCTPQKIAFIGSGPLPLTSLCMLDIYPSAHVHNIDRDTSALSVSQDLCARLGYADRMSFACADMCTGDRGQEMTKWDDFEVVFLAALVGMNTTTKLAILEGLVKQLRSGTLIVARSAKGLRGVLYPIFDLGEDLDKIGLEMLVEVHPWTKVVNSIIVLRVKVR